MRSTRGGQAGRAVAALLVCAALSTVAGVGPALGAPSPEPVGTGGDSVGPVPSRFVKYYLVGAAADGRPEQLRQIAQRLLGAEARFRELLELNAGRTQPDGGRMTDPASLRSGWVLLLPWDAAGEGVRYGVPPDTTAGAARPGQPAAADGSATCASRSTWDGSGVSWAQLRLVPDSAWARSRGDGVTVAVVDSGVDAAVPALTGRVRPGVDLSSAGLRGDRDCLGHGTALATIVAAQPAAGQGVFGMAPAATILPIRLATPGGTVRPADPSDVVRALAAAAAGGATVVLIGVPLDVSDEQIRAALHAAAARDVVVVLPAPPVGIPVSGMPANVLRVGAAGPDDRPVGDHPPGSVDVLAPGVRVASLSVGGGAVEGSGADFAAPFVAGLVAVLRAGEPELSAVAVVDRVQRTADNAEDGPDPRIGWGMISPGDAAGAKAHGDGTDGQGRFSTGDGASLALLLVAVLSVLAMSMRRRRAPGPLPAWPAWLRRRTDRPGDH